MAFFKINIYSFLFKKLSLKINLNVVLFCIFFLGIKSTSNAQVYDASQYNKNKLNRQSSFKVGFIGGWLAYEQPIAENVLINAEFGYEFGFYKSTFASGTEYVATSSFSIEPRYYYNYDKRAQAGKTGLLNAGNYIALEIQAIPNWSTYFTEDGNNIAIRPAATILPKIGMKRAIGPIISFELAGGLGYQINDGAKNRLAAGIDLRLGFGHITY